MDEEILVVSELIRFQLSLSDGSFGQEGQSLDSKNSIFETVNDAQPQGPIDTVEAKKSVGQVAKILLPHIALSLFMLGYLTIGAALFQMLEKEKEWGSVERKADTFRSIYLQIQNKVTEMCSPTDAGWKRKLYSALHELSIVHARRAVNIDPDKEQTASEILEPKWNYIEAILYALSILTTTGYTKVMPVTSLGKTFAMVYGLIGIPLMVFTAVDIGRFLSESILFVYTHIFAWCAIPFQKLSKPKDGVVTKLVKKGSVADVANASKAETAKSRSPSSTRKETCPSRKDTVVRRKDTVLSRKDTTLSRRHTLDRKDTRRRGRHKRKKEEKRKLPLWVNASVLLVFCGIGAVTLMAFTQNPHLTFSDAFFVAFNLVANLTMEEVGEVNDFLTVVYIGLFVTFGLAVLSMCAELAAAGNPPLPFNCHSPVTEGSLKIRRKKKKKVDKDVDQLLKIITAIRTVNPEKEKITAGDILQYIHERQERSEAAKSKSDNPFMPHLDLKFADDPNDPMEMDIDDVATQSPTSFPSLSVDSPTPYEYTHSASSTLPSSSM